MSFGNKKGNSIFCQCHLNSKGTCSVQANIYSISPPMSSYVVFKMGLETLLPDYNYAWRGSLFARFNGIADRLYILYILCYILLGLVLCFWPLNWLKGCFFFNIRLNWAGVEILDMSNIYAKHGELYIGVPLQQVEGEKKQPRKLMSCHSCLALCGPTCCCWWLSCHFMELQRNGLTTFF